MFGKRWFMNDLRFLLTLVLIPVCSFAQQSKKDWKFVAAVAVASVPNLVDVARTNQCLRAGTCVEIDPTLGSHPSTIRMYSTSFGVEAAFALASFEMRRHGSPSVRKLWFLPLEIITVAHAKPAIGGKFR